MPQTANSNTPSHRYAGLLVCGDCGAKFVTINQYWNGKCRVEYFCKTYMSHGKGTYAPHRNREERLDQIVQDDMSRCRDVAAQELEKLINRKNAVH